MIDQFVAAMESNSVLILRFCIYSFFFFFFFSQDSMQQKIAKFLPEPVVCEILVYQSIFENNNNYVS